jgi:hypothetical protein
MMKASTRTTDQARSSGTHGAHGGARIDAVEYLAAFRHVKRMRMSASTPIRRGSTKQSSGHRVSQSRSMLAVRAKVLREVQSAFSVKLCVHSVQLCVRLIAVRSRRTDV